MAYIRCPRCNSQYFMLSKEHEGYFNRMLKGEIVSFRERISREEFATNAIVRNLKEDARIGFIGCNYSRDSDFICTFKVKASTKLIDMQCSSFKATIVPPSEELYCELCEQKIQVPYYCNDSMNFPDIDTSGIFGDLFGDLIGVSGERGSRTEYRSRPHGKQNGHMIITNMHVEDKYLVPKERLSLLQNRAVKSDGNIDVKVMRTWPLTDVLQFMIDIEEKIEKTSLLLLELYKAVDDADRKVTKAKYVTIRQYLSTIIRLENQRDTVNARPSRTAVCVSNTDYEARGIYAPVKPVEPVQPSILKPKPPVLQKPGLFNRKRIESENAVAQKEYEEAEEKYRLAWEKYQFEQIAYNDSMEKYNRQKQEYDAQCEIVFQSIVEEAERKDAENKIQKERELYEIRHRIAALDKKISQIEDLDESYAKDVTGYSAYTFWREEVQKLEKALLELYHVHNVLKESNFVYPKYYTLPILSTICEYFESGRCSEFSGPYGAYNLYETEARAKLVISKLDSISGSLEKIKENQYKLYHIVSNINWEVKQIKPYVEKASSSLSRMNSELNDIMKLSEVNMYYSKMTAYYGELNAKIASAPRFGIIL